MVSQRIRIAPTRIVRKIRTTAPSCSGAAVSGFLRSQTPSKGANRTATNQDTISAIDHDGEDRERIFAGRAPRKADRHEPRRRDE